MPLMLTRCSAACNQASVLVPHNARQAQFYKQAAKIFTRAQCHLSTVDFDDISNDREAEPGARLASVKPGAAIENTCTVGLGNALSVVFDPDGTEVSLRRSRVDRHEYASASIFCCVFNAVSKYFIEILPLQRDHRISGCILRHIDIEPDVRVESSDSALHAFSRLAHIGPGEAARAATDGPRAGKMVVNLPPHRRRFALDQLVKIRRVGSGSIVQYG